MSLLTVDKERYGLLNYQAMLVCHDDSSKAFKIAQDAYDLGIKEGNKIHSVFALIAMAYCQTLRSKFDAAQVITDDAFQALKTFQDVQLNFEATRIQSLIYARQGKFHKAIEMSHDLLRLSRDLEDEDAEGTVLHNLGAAYLQLENYKDAQRYLKQSLKLSEDAGNTMRRVITQSNLADALLGLGDAHAALKLYRHSLTLYEEQDDFRFSALIFVSMAKAYLMVDEVEKALERLNLAQGMYETLEDDAFLAYTLMYKAEAYEKLEQFEKAEQFYLDSTRILREIKDYYFFAQAAKKYADLLSSQGKHEQSESYKALAKQSLEEAGLLPE